MIIYYARNQTMFTNRTFYNKDKAKQYVGKNGFVETYELKDDDYFYLTNVETIGDGGAPFGVELCAKRVEKKINLGTQKICKYSFENIIGMPEWYEKRK